MKLLLARHGITDWNKSARFQGRTDRDLSEDGVNQAECLARRLKDFRIDVIYTSPLKRAFYTADEIAKPHGLSPVILPELEEINFGSWEGLSLKSLDEKHHEAFRRWKSDPFFNPPENAETWPQLNERITRAVNIMTTSGHENVIAVTHGGIIRAILAIVLGLSPHSVWNIEVFNCSLSCIDINTSQSTLLFSNDTHHLPDSVNLRMWEGFDLQ